MIPVAQIFLLAQSVWNARAVAPYESFTLPCAQTFLANRCEPGTEVRFVVRMSDGKDAVFTVPAPGVAAVTLERGGYIFGPAGAPFGFYRASAVASAPAPSPPPNLAEDPMQTIATVTAVDRAYDIRFAGTVTVDARPCYHLVLRPLRDPGRFRLRELWIEEGTYQVVRLTYEQPFNSTTATVHYDFAPAGKANVWTIVHIDAEAKHEEPVSEDLQNIQFSDKAEPGEDP